MTKQLFPLLKYMINISLHGSLHIIPFISPCSYIVPWAYWLSGWYHELGLIKGMIWKMQCNNLHLSLREICNLNRVLLSCLDALNLLLPKTSWSMVNLSSVWLSCLSPLVFLLQKTFELYVFPICWCWVYLMKVIQETHYVN